MTRACAVLLGSLAILATVHASGAAAGSVPTFSRDVAPIVFRNCLPCHRPGEVVPEEVGCLVALHPVSCR